MTDAKKLEIFAMLMETPLAAVLECMASKDFEYDSNVYISPGETVIGELTCFEKALDTVRKRMVCDNNELDETHQKNIEEAIHSSKSIPREIVEQINNQLQCQCAIIDAMENLIAANITSRLEKELLADYTSVRVCENHKIVLT